MLIGAFEVKFSKNFVDFRFQICSSYTIYNRKENFQHGKNITAGKCNFPCAIAGELTVSYV